MTPGSGADGLSAEGLVCSLGNRTLFKGLSLAVAPGQWLALTGENGAGKSTLLRILAGLLRPAAGPPVSYTLPTLPAQREMLILVRSLSLKKNTPT